jgi:hypothetical protein
MHTGGLHTGGESDEDVVYGGIWGPIPTQAPSPGIFAAMLELASAEDRVQGGLLLLLQRRAEP